MHHYLLKFFVKTLSGKTPTFVLLQLKENLGEIAHTDKELVVTATARLFHNIAVKHAIKNYETRYNVGGYEFVRGDYSLFTISSDNSDIQDEIDAVGHVYLSHNFSLTDTEKFRCLRNSVAEINILAKDCYGIEFGYEGYNQLSQESFNTMINYIPCFNPIVEGHVVNSLYELTGLTPSEKEI